MIPKIYTPRELLQGPFKGRISRDTLYELLHTGRLRSFKAGKTKFLISETALLEFINGEKHPHS